MSTESSEAKRRSEERRKQRQEERRAQRHELRLIEAERMHIEVAHVRIDYPEAEFLPDNKAIKYAEAIKNYPDLAELGSAKLVLLAYDFRQELVREYRGEHTSELANARCNIQLGGFEDKEIPEDLPALNFEKECIICTQEKKGINLCSKCWQLIRKCLDLKGESHREGWVGWGNEMNLDLEPLVKLLKDNGVVSWKRRDEPILIKTTLVEATRKK